MFWTTVFYSNISILASRSNSKFGTGSSISFTTTESAVNSPSATPPYPSVPLSSTSAPSAPATAPRSSLASVVPYSTKSRQHVSAPSAGFASSLRGSATNSLHYSTTPSADVSSSLRPSGTQPWQNSGAPNAGVSHKLRPPFSASPSLPATNASQYHLLPGTALSSKLPPLVSASPSYSAFNSSGYYRGPTTAFSGSMPQYKNASQSTFPACKPVSGYDAKSCSCATRANSWYVSHAIATTTPIVCQYSMASGYVYSFTPGCFPQTSTVLAEPYVAPDECCSGPCRIRAEGVRLVYWASDDMYVTNATNTTLASNPSSNITLAPKVSEEPYTLVEDGFTFTSPSVYVIYSSISASQSCVARFDSSVLRGSTHYVTRAYPPDALSTANCGPSAWESGAWSAINYAQLYTAPTWPEIHQRFDACRSGEPEISYEFASHQIANPQLSFPPDVNRIDPAWSTCSGIYLGANDPPRVLSKVNGLGPVTAQVPKPAMVHTKVPEPASSVLGSLPKETNGVPGALPAFHTSVADFVPKPTATSTTHLGAYKPGDSCSACTDPTQCPTCALNAPVVLVSVPAIIPSASAQAPTVKPAVFITGLPDATKPNSAQAAGVPDWSWGALTAYYHTTVAAIAPQESAATAQVSAAAAKGGISALAWSNFAQPVNPQPSLESVGGKEPASSEVVQPQPDSSGTGTDTAHNSSPNVAGPHSGGSESTDQGINPATLEAGNPKPETHGSGSTETSTPKIAIPQSGSSESANPGLNPATLEPVDAPSTGGTNEGTSVSSNAGAPPGPLSPSSGSGSPGIGQNEEVPAPKIAQGQSSTQVVPASNPAAIPALPSIGGSKVQLATNGAIVIGSTTMPPSHVITIGGKQVSVAPQGVVVDFSTYPYAAPTPVMASPVSAAPIQVGGQQIQRAPNGLGVVYGGSTIANNAQATISGHVVSAGTNNVVLDQSSYALPAMASPTPVVVDGHTVQKASANGVVFAGVSILSGQTATVAGHTAYAAGPNSIVVDQSTYTLPAAAASQTIVGGQTLKMAPNGAVVLDSITVPPGSKATISGHDISAGFSNVVVDSSTYALPTSSPSNVAPAVVIGGQSAQRGANGVITFGGARIMPGAKPTVIAGKTVSAGSDNLLVDGNIYALPAPAPVMSQPLLVDGQTVRKGQSGEIMIGSSTIMPGSKETIGGHIVSVESGHVLLDGITYALPSGTGSVFESSKTDTDTSGVVTLLNGDTISAGGQAATFSGTPISVLPSDEGLLVGTRTIPLPSAQTFGHMLTTAGEVFTAVNNQVIVGGSTLPEGSVTTIHGTRVSLGDSGLVVGLTTIALPTLGLPSAAPAVTTLGETFSQIDASHVAFGRHTLSIGGHETMIRGTEVSFGKSGLVVGSSTMAFPTAAPTLTTLDHTFVPVDASEVALDGTTFSIGGKATTIDGSLVSVGSSGLVIGGTTIPISIPSTASAVEAMTTDGYTISRLDASRVVVDGSTLTEGESAKIVHGTRISIGASEVDIGSQSIPFFETVKATATSGYGSFIIGGLQGSKPAATQPPWSSTSASQASAGGTRARGEAWAVSIALGLGTCIGLLAMIL